VIIVNKRSKGIRLKEMQTRKDHALEMNGEKNNCCGEMPIPSIWKHRAKRLEENRRG
jgi:hypothetical protein